MKPEVFARAGAVRTAFRSALAQRRLRSKTIAKARCDEGRREGSHVGVPGVPLSVGCGDVLLALLRRAALAVVRLRLEPLVPGSKTCGPFRNFEVLVPWLGVSASAGNDVTAPRRKP
jgi:hypothetical protein